LLIRGHAVVMRARASCCRRSIRNDYWRRWW